MSCKRYVVLSDIHSNLEALRAVFAAVDGLDVDGFLCLGDVVGYGPDPGAVIELVRQHEMVVVRGNHDNAAVDPGEEVYFNEWAVAAIRWTRDHLIEDDRRYLSDLPLEGSLNDALSVRMVHASPSAPAAWRYVLSLGAAAMEFATFSEQICFIGHSHVPMVAAEVNGSVKGIKAGEIPLLPDVRLIVNVGSVGQPRDGDPRACFVLLDLEEGKIRFERAEYDVERTARKIAASELPAFLGERLHYGQ